MFRLVARQWQTPRGARRLPQLRAGSQYVKPFRPCIQQLNSAILIPSSVTDTRPEDLVEHITAVPAEDVATNTFCVLLVTPSFSPWLQDDTFVANAIRKAYGGAPAAVQSPLAIQTLCAVVDKLPSGRPLSQDALKAEVMERSRAPPTGEPGYEGVAFVTLPAAASVSSTSPRSPEKGAIDFIFAGPGEGESDFSDTWRLPLANTVFQTGVPTTMMLSSWAFDGAKDRLELLKKTDITHHGIAANAKSNYTDDQVSTLAIPLLPLTFPRKVEGYMGNIIRSVVGPDGESITASSELERVVPRFFKARGEPAQPTTAWALVLPKTKRPLQRTREMLSKRLSSEEKASKKQLPDEMWDRMWRYSYPSWNRLVPMALAEGARLHRVLSGGGGWGKKAGLLSLDPVPVSEEIPIRMEDATSDFDGPGDFSEALTPVVGEGDAIQFFISPTPPARPWVEGSSEFGKLRALPTSGSHGWEIGTVPSTVDSLPGGSWQHTVTDEKYVAVFRNTFGALAEGGLTLTRRQRRVHTKPLEVIATTTVDVPYSRFWTARLAEETDSSTNFTCSWQFDSREFWGLPTKLPLQDSGKHVKTRHNSLAKPLPDWQANAVVERSLPPQQPATPMNIIRAAPASFSIRKVSSNGVSDSALVSERLYQISAAITVITEECKATMHTIRRRGRQTREVKHLRNQELLKKQRHQRRLVALRKKIDRFSVFVKGSDTLIGSIGSALEEVAMKVLGRLPDVGPEMRMPTSTLYPERPVEVPKIRIRRFVSGIIRGGRLDTKEFATKARQLGQAVALLADQSEIIASRIKQRISDHTDFILSEQQPRERAFLAYLSQLPAPAHSSTQTTPKPALSPRAKALVRRFVAVPQHKLLQTKNNTQAIQEELQRTLRHLDRLAHHTSAANKSAEQVYGIHIALRLRLGKMILYRQKRGVTVLRLESHLLALRTYDGMLSATPETQPVRATLSEAEMRNPVQRTLGRIRAERRVEDGSVQIRYRRTRLSSRAPRRNRVVRYTALHRLRVKTHLSRASEKRRTRVRPKPRVTSLAQKKRSAKMALVDEVGAWLGGGKGEKDGMALLEQTAKRQSGGRRRAFGSRSGGGDV